ncbi:MAG: hypothetical protein DSZ03_04835 [Sulfurimonas sp.]|nr:MAG: hypothetical protein DSZ03_04835 [Sulfurimonas sp.]
MKKFNLFNEIIVVERSKLLHAINSAKEFAITYEGAVIDEHFDTHPLIYRGTVIPHTASTLAPQTKRALKDILGHHYNIIEDDERVLIKAAAAWKEILNLNIRHCDYDDSSGDGIALFADKELELMGWHATEFDIEYRDMVTVIESACEGILLCIEQEEPYQFSGLGFIFDIMCARTRVREFCIESIQDKLQNDSLFSQENLSDDEREAAEFFGVL